MKRTIAIIAGGDSSEHDVSMRSAQGILSFINKDKYNCYIVEIKATSWQALLPDGSHSEVNRNDFSFATPQGTIKPDYAYITIHGKPGENGVLQGYLDLIKMPYSTGGVLVEALTFNKFTLNNYLKSWGIRVADSILLRHNQISSYNEEEIITRLGLPCFVKPNADGSSFGVTKVKQASQLSSAIQAAFKEDNEVMIESFLNGTEITCGCYKTKTECRVLPITEVVTNQEFFDYDAKYNGKVEEITPARIAPATAERVSQLTSTIYDILGCNGIIRIDYILSGEPGNETITMLEVNTTPGMTATSFIPQQIKAAGLDIGEVLSQIIENSF